MASETPSSAALKRSIYLLVLPAGGVAALVVGVTGSFDPSRSTANWVVAAMVGVVLLAATVAVAVRPRVSRVVEVGLVVAAVVAFATALATVVASSMATAGTHVDGVVRVAMWTAAVSGFAHLALSSRLAGIVSSGLWVLLVVAAGVVLATDGSATVGDRTTLMEALLVQGCAVVTIIGIVRVTGAERKRATMMASLATSDALTGLTNRRGADERLEQEVDRARRYGHPLSIAWFDLDRLKQVNDRYGHAVGDRVLRAVSAVARQGVRAHDTVVRWGGEEFVVLLPHQTQDEAMGTAERLRRALGEHDLGLAGGERVTASFGVAELGPTEMPSELLRRADKAVYAAKDQGRDRVVASPPSRPSSAVLADGDVT